MELILINTVHNGDHWSPIWTGVLGRYDDIVVLPALGERIGDLASNSEAFRLTRIGFFLRERQRPSAQGILDRAGTQGSDIVVLAGSKESTSFFCPTDPL